MHFISDCQFCKNCHSRLGSEITSWKDYYSLNFCECDDDDQYKPRLCMHRYESMTIKILYFPHRYRALSLFSLNFQHSISPFSQLGSMIRAAAAAAKKYFDNIFSNDEIHLNFILFERGSISMSTQLPCCVAMQRVRE